MNGDILNRLDQAFTNCASPANHIRSDAEAQLNAMKTHPEYALALLNYILMQNKPIELQLRAAIEIKRWLLELKNRQQFEIDTARPILEDIKKMIIPAYLNSHEKIATQLSAGIVGLASVEFPDLWPNLMTMLIGHAEENIKWSLPVVKLMKKLTDRFSYEMRSDPLYREIIKVCDDVHDFLLKITQYTLTRIMPGSNNQSAGGLEQEYLMKLMKTNLKLFYNLNYQDLHPLFEDNLQTWMNILATTMRLPNDVLPEAVFKMKGEALKSILLYASKYKEDVDSCIRDFSKQIWALCSNTTDDPQYDKIVLNALRYFKHLVCWSDMKDFFASNLGELLKTLVLPNIGITKNLAESFQDEPAAFIQTLFQNSQIGSRRNSAIQLMRTLCRNYNFNDYLSGYIQAFVSTSFENESKKILSECLLLILVIDSGLEAYRSIDGITSTKINDNIIQYVYMQVVKPVFQDTYQWLMQNPDKCIPGGPNLIRLSVHLRYIYFFRLYIPKEELIVIVKFLCALVSDSSTFNSINYMVLDAFILLKHGDYKFYRDFVYFFDQTRLNELAEEILKKIYFGEQKEKTLNFYMTRVLYSLAKSLKEFNVTYEKHFVHVISSMLQKTDSYQFKCVLNVFETLGQLIYYLQTQGNSIAHIQRIVDDFLRKALTQGSDLLNFVFQIYSLIIETSPTNTVTQNHSNIYNSILLETNWVATNNSLFHAYIQYLCAYLSKSPDKIITNRNKIQIVLTKLIETSNTDLFYSTLLQILSITGLEGFANSGYLNVLIQGIKVILQLTHDNPNNKILAQKAALLFLSRCIQRNNPTVFVQLTNQVSEHFVENICIQSVQIINSIHLREERRIVMFALSNLLLCNLFSSTEKFGVVLNALIENTRKKSSSIMLHRRLMDGNDPNSLQSMKSDSAYQKLTVFKLIDKVKQDAVGDQQKYLVDTFQTLYNQNGQVAQLLSQQNQEQLTVLIKKYSSV